MKYTIKITSLASVAALALVFLGGGIASADTGANLNDRAGSSSRTEINQECQAAISAASVRTHQKLPIESCNVVITTSFSGTKLATLAEVNGLKDVLATSDFNSLTKAVALGTVRSRTYLQQINNITDSETQTGTFYYDGVRAWVTQPYRGFVGTHRCQIDWAVGFSVSPQNCYESGSSSVRILSQQWLMTPFFAGVPVSWSQTYSLRVDSLGQVW